MKSFNEIDDNFKIMFENSPAKRVERILKNRNKSRHKKEKTKSFFVSRKRMNNKMPKASVQLSRNPMTRNPFSDKKKEMSPPKRSHIYKNGNRQSSNRKFSSVNNVATVNYKGVRRKKPLFSMNNTNKYSSMIKMGKSREPININSSG